MLELNSENSLQAWLEARPEATRYQDAVALSSRAAARVLPHIFSHSYSSEQWQSTLILCSFRAIAAARLVALVPSRAAQEAANSARSAAYSVVLPGRSAARSARSADSAARSAAFSAARSAASPAVDFAAYSADLSAALSADSAAASAAFSAISRDATMIEEKGAAKTLLAPLPFLTWEYQDQNKEVKQSIAPRWSELKAFYLAQPNEDWQVWIDWYERIVAGTSSPRAIEEAYVFLDDPKLWDQGPAAANSAIREKLEDVSEGEKFKPPPKEPIVPPQSPAAIEPEWHGDELGLPKTSAKTDLSDSDLIAALQSLKQGLLDTAEDADAEGNLDPRIARSLRRLADKIPEGEVPPQHVIFTLGHAQEKLVDLQSTVIAEASTSLAADYQSLLRQFDRAVRQFPRWREYVRNADKDTLTKEDIEATQAAAAEIKKILEDAASWDLVSEEIAKAFDELEALLGQKNNDDPSEDAIKNGADLLALDVIESIENIAKRLSENILSLKDDFNIHFEHDREALQRIWKSKTIADAREAFKIEFAEELKKEAKKLGKDAAKAPRYLLKVGVVVLIGWALGVGPLASAGVLVGGEITIKASKKFKWLKDFLDWLKR